MDTDLDSDEKDALVAELKLAAMKSPASTLTIVAKSLWQNPPRSDRQQKNHWARPPPGDDFSHCIHKQGRAADGARSLTASRTRLTVGRRIAARRRRRRRGGRPSQPAGRGRNVFPLRFHRARLPLLSRLLLNFSPHTSFPTHYKCIFIMHLDYFYCPGVMN